MLKEAYDLLESKYQKCFDTVKNDAYFTSYANEKKRHSFQVMGAGNYLIRHIKWLQDKPVSYIELVKTAIFLHDICRFAEIENLFLFKKRCDHGVEGCNFLKEIPLFNDIRIWLSIKHHGHLIKDLYNDREYQNIEDKDLQKQVEQICFIIRDADKIANLHMIVCEKDMHFLFLGKKEEDYSPQTDGVVSDITKEEAFSGRTISRNRKVTVAELCVSYLSWYTDINYQAAIDYCSKLNVTPKLIKIFEDHCIDEEFKKQYADYFRQYVAEHTYIL